MGGSVEGWRGGWVVRWTHIPCTLVVMVPLHPGFRLWAASLSAARFGPSVGSPWGYRPRFGRSVAAPAALAALELNRSGYMAYNGDLFRHYIRNYWYEVWTKFDDCGTKFVEPSTKYNPEVIKYTP